MRLTKSISHEKKAAAYLSCGRLRGLDKPDRVTSSTLAIDKPTRYHHSRHDGRPSLGVIARNRGQRSL